MSRPPRNPDTPVLTGELSGRIVLVGTMLLLGSFGLFEWALSGGASVAEARTVAVNVFVIVELFYVFNCRSLTKSIFQIDWFSNPWVIAGAASMIALQLFYTYAPAMNRMFHSAPIGWTSWLWIVAVGVATSALVGFEKWLRRWHASRGAKPIESSRFHRRLV